MNFQRNYFGVEAYIDSGENGRGRGKEYWEDVIKSTQESVRRYKIQSCGYSYVITIFLERLRKRKYKLLVGLSDGIAPMPQPNKAGQASPAFRQIGESGKYMGKEW